MDNEVKTLDEFFPDTINKIRKSYQKNKKELNNKEFSNSKVAQIYYATMRCNTGAISTIAKLLCISPDELRKYMESVPEAAFAYRAALIDKRAELEESLTNVLIDSTINGQVIREVRTEQSGFSTKTIKTKRQIPPNPTMALEILKRLSPDTWGDKLKVSGKVEGLVRDNNLIENVNVEVDYRKLSKDVLRELIESQREEKDEIAFKKEDGTTTVYLKEAKMQVGLQQKPDKPEKRKRQWTEEQRKKIMESRTKTENRKKEKNKENKDNG